jgi:hypothetical protein
MISVIFGELISYKLNNMSKIYTFIIALLLMFLSPCATVAQWLPDSNAVWSEWTEKFILTGDSTVNGITYQKVGLIDSINSLDLNVLEPLANHWALIRQDTSGKVYTITTIDTAEVLLYDFNASVGDTLELQPFLTPLAGGFRTQVFVIIEAIDSVIIGTTWRIRLKINTVGLFGNNFSADEYWIEGIGSTAGLFGAGSYGFVASDFDYPTLLCFTQNDNLVYDSPLHSACFRKRTVSLAENAIALKIYPNPANHYLQIENANPQPLKIRVYDSRGKFMRAFSLDSGEQKIDLPQDWHGLYILEINTLENSQPLFKRLLVR